MVMVVIKQGKKAVIKHLYGSAIKMKHFSISHVAVTFLISRVRSR